MLYEVITVKDIAELVADALVESAEPQPASRKREQLAVEVV